MNGEINSANIEFVKNDAVKFISALALTALLAAMVVLSGYRRDSRSAGMERVNVEEVERLAEKGALSLKEAEFYEVIEAPLR